ncbi:MAG: NifB/NifX family molybdenum-iron cluster-binding protein [Pirellulaceae bacterium]|jgi:predicted Fe-Mo cluster-binding NifX family protein|nr:NifB/NifX family molybdenum-iron cluster-binding protein [Pirellulaceae bacterium]
MKVAVASVDGVSISHHFGRSQCFIVFDVQGTEIGAPEVRPNTYTAHARGECDGAQGHHDQPHSHASIVAALQDCSAVLCYGMGWRAAEDLSRNGIKPFVIDGVVSPQEAVQQFVNGRLKPASGFCGCH